MADVKKGNVGPASKSTKTPPPARGGAGKPGGDSSNKLVILVGVLLAFAAVVLYLYVFSEDKSESPAEPSANVSESESESPVGGYQPMAAQGVPTQAPTNTGPPLPALTVKAPTSNDQAGAISANVEEFLKRYDQTVVDGKWPDLAAWAMGKGLYVEAFRCQTMTGKAVPPPMRLQESRILISLPNAGAAMVGQWEFEVRYSLKTPPEETSYTDVVSQLEEMQPGGGIANLSKLARLLALADCPKGRELYQKSVKEKEFYELLAREIPKAYLKDLKLETTGLTSWYRTVPMNLWLIRQMIKMDPSKLASTDTVKPTATPAAGNNSPPAGAPPGGMPMGSGGPGRSSGSNEPGGAAFEHRLMLLQVLARRGGLVSSYLIGKLLVEDKDEVLLGGVASGKIPEELFLRFTGVYAEPLISPFVKGLEKRRSLPQEWTGLAKVLAGMQNDRASHGIFTSAKDGAPLPSEVGFILAAGGSPYVLDTLAGFVQSSRTQGIDVEKVFDVWTARGSTRVPIWNLIGGWIPGIAGAKSPGKAGPGGSPMAPGMMPGGTVPPGGTGTMPPGAFTGPMPQTPAYSFPGNRGPQAVGQAGKGLPAVRKFVAGVDRGAATEFLKRVGLSSAGAMSSPSGPGTMGYGPGMSGGGTSVSPATMRTGALRCLISLYDSSLRDYFRKISENPDVGGIGRLGLCLLDDQASCPAILKTLWKKPFDLNKTLGSGAASNQAVTVQAGRVVVPLDAGGYIQCGISAREALIYFDYREAGRAFKSALGEFITRKEPFDDPERVAEAAGQMIEALGRWSVPETASLLADMIESTGDFGLRGAERTTGNQPEQNPLAAKVRMKALVVLGKIGDETSMKTILRMGMFKWGGDPLGVAARVALAKRGYGPAVDIFLNMLDPKKSAEIPKADSGKGTDQDSTQLVAIDPSLRTAQDVALLGLSRASLDEAQTRKVLDLIKTLGETEKSASPAGSENLQERLVLSVLSSGQGGILRGLAALVGESPLSGSEAGSGNVRQVYYWNGQQESGMDKAFFKMVQALEPVSSFEDEDGLVQFLTAVLKREEAVLIPQGEELKSWSWAQGLVKFETSKSSSSGGMAGPAMPPMEMSEIPDDLSAGSPPELGAIRRRVGLDRSGPTGAGPTNIPVTPAVSAAAAKSSLDRLNVKFPRLQTRFGSEGPQAPGAALNLFSRLKGSARFLKELRDLPFFRYHANFLLWQAGDVTGRVELVKLLAENSETNEALFTKFLAVEQLERSDALALAGVFADAFRKCPAGPTRIRLGDGAMHVALSAWDNQMRGNLAVLNDSAKVGPVAEAWKGVADAKNYDRFSANPMVITLACLPKYPATIKWIQDIVRLLANRNQPVTEQAVGAAVEVLRSLKPEGGPVLLDLYVTLLNLTADPEKQKSLSGSVEEEYKAKEKRSTGGGETPAAKPGGRTARPARSSGGGGRSGGGAASTSVRKPEYNFAYTAIGPNLILGISRMGTPEAFNALVQVARSRPDLLGFTAWEIYTKDKKMGMLLIRQLLVESGKNPDLKDQAKMVLARLTMASPDEVMVEAIFRAITKADPSVSEYAVEKLSQFSKEGKIPANVNLAQSMKTILQNLLTEKRTGRAVDSVLTKALEFAKTISDKELQRSVERIEGAIEKAKQPSGRKSRSR